MVQILAILLFGDFAQLKQKTLVLFNAKKSNLQIHLNLRELTWITNLEKSCPGNLASTSTLLPSLLQGTVHLITYATHNTN